MSFALSELSNIYPIEEIKALVYYLFEEFLHISKTDYILNKQKGMSESELLKFNFAIKDLKQGKPLQYILGYSYFNDLKFFVNPETLIPRQETEELVQLIIKKEKQEKSLKILDIGTGTGCIPISLAKEMPQHQYSAIDFKEEIIQLAKKNANLNKVNISFQVLDILRASTEEIGFYDIIISNPPYVKESEKQKMHKNVLDHEPESALYVPDEKALLFYEKIIQIATQHLKPNGRLYLEINENKGKEMKVLLASEGFEQIMIHQDIHGKDRMLSARISL